MLDYDDLSGCVCDEMIEECHNVLGWVIQQAMSVTKIATVCQSMYGDLSKYYVCEQKCHSHC